MAIFWSCQISDLSCVRSAMTKTAGRPVYTVRRTPVGMGKDAILGLTETKRPWLRTLAQIVTNRIKLVVGPCCYATRLKRRIARLATAAMLPVKMSWLLFNNSRHILLFRVRWHMTLESLLPHRIVMSGVQIVTTLISQRLVRKGMGVDGLRSAFLIRGVWA